MLKQICWCCGKPIPKNAYYSAARRFCEKCEEEHLAKYHEIVTEYAILKNRVMFERAMRMMEQTCADMTKYKRFAFAVEKHSADNPEQYRSADEMIAAVIMLSQYDDIEMNKRIGSYLVDMYIPQMKVILEVDGDRHQYSKKADGERDIKLRKILGNEWEIVRIPTEYIEKDPEKLPEAIKTIYDTKKRLRAENNGILPESFSEREKAVYAKAKQYVTQYARKL